MTTPKPGKKKTTRRAAKSQGKKTPAGPVEIDVRPGWLNKKQMAASLGISVQAFDQYGIEPVAKRHKFGESFFTAEAVVAYKVRRAVEAERERMEREHAKRAPTDVAEMMIEQQRAELELTQERAETQRIKNLQMRRELAPVDGISAALGQLASRIGAVLDPLPGKIRRRQPKLTNADVETIRHECVKAMNLAAELEIDWDALEPVNADGN